MQSFGVGSVASGAEGGGSRQVGGSTTANNEQDRTTRNDGPITGAQTAPRCSGTGMWTGGVRVRGGHVWIMTAVPTFGPPPHPTPPLPPSQPVRNALDASTELADIVHALRTRRTAPAPDPDPAPNPDSASEPEPEPEPDRPADPSGPPLPPGPALARQVLERLPELAASSAAPVRTAVMSVLATAVGVLGPWDPAGLLPLLHQLWPSLVRFPGAAQHRRRATDARARD